MRSPLAASLACLVALPSLSSGQQPASLPSEAEQVAAAVLPLPADLQAGATVMGYRTAGKLETLRPGTNGMICLALYVTRPDFHVACYHKGLEPFMARGRELRAQGVKEADVDPTRFREIANGTLKMPKQGALYSITGRKDGWDAKTGKVTGATPLAVVYMPFATPDDTGIPAKPQEHGPWLMFPGTPKAHIMLVGTMTP